MRLEWSLLPLGVGPTRRVIAFTGGDERQEGFVSWGASMEMALDLVTIAGGLAAGWLADRSLNSWRKRAGRDGGAIYQRAEVIYAAAVITATFGGAIITRLIFGSFS